MPSILDNYISLNSYNSFWLTIFLHSSCSFSFSILLTHGLLHSHFHYSSFCTSFMLSNICYCTKLFSSLYIFYRFACLYDIIRHSRLHPTCINYYVTIRTTLVCLTLLFRFSTCMYYIRIMNYFPCYWCNIC